MSGPTPSVQFAWDGPGALGAGDDGKALCWNQSAGRFVLTAKAAASHTHAPGDLTQGGASSGQALVWNGAAWAPAAAGVTDHGALTGLSDDDHSQYALADGSRGSFAATSHTHAPSAITQGGASSGQVLTWNGSAWAPATPATVVTDHGNLTGLSDDDHAQYALLTPTASTRNIIQPSTATVKALVLKGASSQSANIFEVQNSGGTALLTLDATGLLTLTQASGTSGKTLKIVPAPEGASGNIIEIYTRNPGGTTLGFSVGPYGSIAVTQPSISTAIQFSTATIGLWGYGGLWDLELNDYGYASTCWMRWSSKSSPTNGAAVWIQNPTNAANVALVVKGKSGQTANLQQWQNSSGTVLAFVDASGGMSLSSLLALGLPIISLPSGGTFKVRDGASQVLFETTHAAGTAKLYQYDAAGVALTVRGATAQSANLLNLTDVSAAVQFAIGATGRVCTNQALTNTNTPSGATAKAMPFYDASGTLLGYAPLYASTW